MKCRKGFEVQALKANMAYIGTFDPQEGPNCRCSQEYFNTLEDAKKALAEGTFTLRRCMENDFCNGGRGCF